jgi:Fur family ferric uptake transcriptional regulator
MIVEKFMKTSSVDQLILERLSFRHGHYTSQEIFDELKSTLPAVNRSTVYRSLDRLVGAGKVSVSDLGTGALVYETVGEGLHHHLVCQQCHQIVFFPHEEVEHFFHNVEKNSQFIITTNHLILYGICKECQTE